MQNKQLENWEKATEELTTLFLEKYFDGETDYYWVGADIGGVLFVGDYFFNFDRIVEAIKYQATKKQLFGFYDLEIETLSNEKEMKMNFKNYIKNK